MKMKKTHNWTLGELKELYDLPLFELLSKSHQIHRRFQPLGEIQVCSLISIKTGGCPEDCKYCSQSSLYQTPISAEPLMSYDDVLLQAKKMIAHGASRICLGAAWRGVRNSKQFDEVLRMVKGIADLGVEVCCTLGLLNEEQADRLKEAGLDSYNHNLDSSEKFYRTIITTRTYQDRLNTLKIVREKNLKVCCGGILGMGEEVEDRLELLLTLSKLDPNPESVPINRLERIPGTPLQDQPSISFWDFLRMIALARIVLPKAKVRLSAGRLAMSTQEHALCFFAGANSIHAGEKLLTIGNPSLDTDEEMFAVLGLKKLKRGR